MQSQKVRLSLIRKRPTTAKTPFYLHGNAAMKHFCDSKGGSDLHGGGTATKNNSLFHMTYSIQEKKLLSSLLCFFFNMI